MVLSKSNCCASAQRWTLVFEPAFELQRSAWSCRPRAFADRLRARSAPSEIPPVPDIDHGKVLDRIESRRRPFSDKGQGRDRGYKDFLIWESLKTYLASQDDVRRLILITGNIKDFADPDNPKLLHQHLREELDSLIDIQVSSSVRDFIKEHVEPYLTEIDLQSIVVSRDANQITVRFRFYEHRCDEVDVVERTLPNEVELGRTDLMSRVDDRGCAPLEPEYR